MNCIFFELVLYKFYKIILLFLSWKGLMYFYVEQWLDER